MKPYRILFFCLTLFTTPILYAQQDSITVAIDELRKEKEKIISEEKEALKAEVERINARYAQKEIGWEEAEQLKSEAAKKHAQNIQNRTAIIDNKIALLQRNEQWEGEESDGSTDPEDDWLGKSHYGRTSTHLLVAAGFNNALLEGQDPNESEFKIGGSRFFEIGIVWKTRVFERSNLVRLRYGFSFQFNGLKPTDNRYFLPDGEVTDLVVFPEELDKSKFRMDNLVFPIHIEFGPSKKIETSRSVWFSTHNRLKIGLGGYGGFSLGERQKLKFEKDGEEVKQKLKGEYNTNNFIYGLSGYIGWGGTALYVKYDLNTIFKEPNPELHNVSVGLRFEVN